MTRLMVALWLVLGSRPERPGANASAQRSGRDHGHWHLNSRDVEANKKIFVAMGGTPVKAGPLEAVRFPASWSSAIAGNPAPAPAAPSGRC